ncbi:DUF1080 domain-containing protein [Parabacteroides sp. PF5-6]|uniref:3-keto-disaccharide hydrolase n=1 Tax=Parabacteroides sp. PF5-6 TaxID=1742403 RepID=UPI002405A117|nr:DUF1080 domain-containing protein [Parabacteroides sp. PF5-6]MDF9829205.1 hypothetical protein [Parabacteroides sp. PF5-6]
MKKLLVFASVAAFAFCLTACGGKKNAENQATEAAEATAEVPEYTLLNLPTVDIATFPKDADGWFTIFDGKTFNGWRGYNKTEVPTRWTIDNGAIKFNGTGGGEAQDGDGGDLIFASKLKNFEFEFEWKVAKGSNSGIFILVQEVEDQPSYISSPEYQVLDNENHPDAKLGKSGNRMSASLYDMLPAKPQNSKPFGEWNKGKILCYKGTVVYYQNDEAVVEYHLWTNQWKEMLDNSKFSKEAWPLAYELLMNCGGPNREGFIAFQDHGDDVWFRNLKVKILD